jgi:hypothetical protein
MMDGLSREDRSSHVNHQNIESRAMNFVVESNSENQLARHVFSPHPTRPEAPPSKGSPSWDCVSVKAPLLWRPLSRRMAKRGGHRNGDAKYVDVHLVRYATDVCS